MFASIQFGSVKSLKKVIQKGLDVDQPDDQGRTPLHFIADKIPFEDFIRKKMIKMTRVLLENGADPLIKYHGVTFLERSYGENMEYVNLVREYTSPEVEIDLYQALCCACSNNAIDTVVYLLELANEQCRRHEITSQDLTRMLNRVLVHSLTTEMIELFLEYGADLNGLENGRGNVLHYTIYFSRDFQLIKFLVNQGVDINKQDFNLNTPLHIAYYRRNENVIRLLKFYGADTELRNCLGIKPEEMKLGEYHNIIKNYLDPNGSLFLTHDIQDKNPLSLACFYGRTEVIELILSVTHEKEDIDQELLFDLVRLNYKEVVQFLLDHWKVNLDKEVYSKTLLYLATESQYKSMTRMLLDRGANPFTVNSDNYFQHSPFSLAVNYSRESIVLIYLERIDHVPEDLSPLNILVRRRMRKAVELFLQRFPERIEERCKETFKTPLMTACSDGNFEMVKLLIQHGAEVNSITNNNETPLILSLKRFTPSLKIIDYLICHGADVNHMTWSGLCPLHFTIIHTFRDCFDRLLECKDIDPNKGRPVKIAIDQDLPYYVSRLVRAGAEVPLEWIRNVSMHSPLLLNGLLTE